MKLGRWLFVILALVIIAVDVLLLCNVHLLPCLP